MDLKNRINSFTELGMCDPFNFDQDLIDAKAKVSKWKHNGLNVYKGVFLDMPKTIFLPKKSILKKIIRAVALFGKTEHRSLFFMRFGLLENHF
jgi:hypothetical protein